MSVRTTKTPIATASVSYDEPSMEDEVSSLLKEVPYISPVTCTTQPFELVDALKNYVYFNEKCVKPYLIFRKEIRQTNNKLFNYIRLIIFLDFYKRDDERSANTIPIIGFRSLVKGTDTDIALDALNHVFEGVTQTKTIKGLKFLAGLGAGVSVNPSGLLKDSLHAEEITTHDLKSIMKSSESFFIFILVDMYCRVKYIFENIYTEATFNTNVKTTDAEIRNLEAFLRTAAFGQGASDDDIKELENLKEKKAILNTLKKSILEQKPLSKSITVDPSRLIAERLFLKRVENDVKTNAQYRTATDKSNFIRYYRHYVDFNQLKVTYYMDKDKNIKMNLTFEDQTYLKIAMKVLTFMFHFSWGTMSPVKNGIHLSNLNEIEESGTLFLQFSIEGSTIKKLISPLKEAKSSVYPQFSPTKNKPRSLEKLDTIRLGEEGLTVPKTYAQQLTSGISSRIPGSIKRFSSSAVSLIPARAQSLLGFVPKTLASYVPGFGQYRASAVDSIILFLEEVTGLKGEGAIQAALKQYVRDYSNRMNRDLMYEIQKSALAEEVETPVAVGDEITVTTSQLCIKAPANINALINKKDLASVFNVDFIPRYHPTGMQNRDLPFAYLSALAYEDTDPSESHNGILTLEIEGKTRKFYKFDILKTELIGREYSDRKPFVENDFKDNRGVENIRLYFEFDSKSFLKNIKSYIKGTNDYTPKEQEERLKQMREWLTGKKEDKPFFRLVTVYRGTHFGIQDTRDLFGADSYILTGKTANEPRFQIANRITANIALINTILREKAIERLTQAQGENLKLTSSEKKLIKEDLPLYLYATGHSLGGTLAILSTYWSIRNPLPKSITNIVSRVVLSYGFNSGASPELMKTLKELPEDSFRIYRSYGDIISFMFEYFRDEFKNKKNIISLPNVNSYDLEHILANHSMCNFLGLYEYTKMFQLKGVTRDELVKKPGDAGRDFILYGIGKDPLSVAFGDECVQVLRFIPADESLKEKFPRTMTLKNKNKPKTTARTASTAHKRTTAKSGRSARKRTAKLGAIQEENESNNNNNLSKPTTGANTGGRRKTRKNRH